MKLYQAALNLLTVSTLVYDIILLPPWLYWYCRFHSLLLVECRSCFIFCSPDPEFGTVALPNEPQYLLSPVAPFQEMAIYVQVLHFCTALTVMSCSPEFLKRR